MTFKEKLVRGFVPIDHEGPVAQWIRHLTTNQGIPGSSPGGVGVLLLLFRVGYKKRYLISTRSIRIDISIRNKPSDFMLDIFQVKSLETARKLVKVICLDIVPGKRSFSSIPTS